MEPQNNKIRISFSWILIFTLIAIVLLFFGLNFFLFNKKSTPKSTLSLPIPVNHSVVNTAIIAYTLKGVINDIHPENNGYSFVLISTSGIIWDKPLFASDASTSVVQKTVIQETPKKLTDLKKGDQVQVSYYQDIKANSPAQVSRIVILISK